MTEIAKVEHTDSRDKRPAQTVFGAGVAFFRGLAFLPIAVLLLLLPAQYAVGVNVEGGRPALILAGSAIALVSLVDIGLAVAVFFGRNWARIVLMLSCVFTTTIAFIGNANGSEAVTLATSLPTVGLSIMVLLALSSHRARAYAARGRHTRSGSPGARTSRPLSDLRVARCQPPVHDRVISESVVTISGEAAHCDDRRAVALPCVESPAHSS